MIGTAILAILRAIGWRGAIVGAAVLAAVSWHLWDKSEAYKAGAQTVRIEWAEANRRAELAAIARQQKQQVEINKTEAELLSVQTQAAMRRRALEIALEAERAANDKNGNDRAECDLPDRVREALRYRTP